MNELIGQPVDRVDGRLKVTGGARYAAEFPFKHLAYAVTIQSTISSGKISAIKTEAAESSPGVLAVITHENAMRLKSPGGGSDPSSMKLGEKELLPLQDNKIYYNGQYVALVIAETFEQADQAARLVIVEYKETDPLIELRQHTDKAYKPTQSMGRPLQIKRGRAPSDPSDIFIEQTYVTPVLHHNPMEPSATIAMWEGTKLTIYDSTQSVIGNRNAVAGMLGIAPNDLHMLCPYVGGGFGCKGFTWAHSVLAPMAARETGRPVKLVLSRQQMFTGTGHRAKTIQKLKLTAKPDGTFTEILHDTLTETSFVEEFVETAGLTTAMLYACPNVDVSHRVVKLNRSTPGPMRAPGEASGTFALECAIDELAGKLKMDPIELRLKNYAEEDPQKNKPWSGKNLRECYQRGAESFGWAQRNPELRSMRDGKLLIGYGMATAVYPAMRGKAAARIQILDDGTAIASSCTQDIGTGTYTIMTQIVAETLGMPLEKVKFILGDSKLPEGPVSGGSQTAASVGPALKLAALSARDKAINLAVADEKSPLHGQESAKISVENGRIFVTGQTDMGESYADVLKRNNMKLVEGISATKGSNKTEKDKSKKSELANDDFMNEDEHSFYSFGAQFAKVSVDPELGIVRVTDSLSVIDIGKVLNLKTAESQVMGGAIFAIGMALMEETIYDPITGRAVTRDLANYLVPVHADMPRFEVQFIDKPDFNISTIGARGVGEIGITGMTAAIANAVYHATGRRLRDLPITPDKLI